MTDGEPRGRPWALAPARESVDPLPPVRWGLAWVAVAAAVLSHLWLQAGALIAAHGIGRAQVRRFYPDDQYAYLSIAKNAGNGILGSVEPFTLTGANHYPRLYYDILGMIAGAAGVDPTTAWNLVGLAAQAVLVGGIGIAAVLLTRRWWAGALAWVPFVLGTLAWWNSGDEWKTDLESHAVLWGPYGTMFTLNGETIALCVAGLGSLTLILLAAGRVRTRRPWLVAAAVCVALGLLASVQTYTFLAVTFLVVYGAAAVGLGMLAGRWRHAPWLVAVTAVMVAGVVIAGPSVAARVSPLATLAFALTPAAPGLLALLPLTRWRVLVPAVALVLGATPQTLGTALGVLQGDPFLLYRQGSSADLGVPAREGLLAGAVIALLALLAAALGTRARSLLMALLPATGAGVWLLLATNDAWGANQEPYRFFNNVAVQLAVVTVPLLLWGLVELRTRRARVDRWIALTAATCAVFLLYLALPDFLLFRATTALNGYQNLRVPQKAAAAEAAAQSGGSLVLPDPCIDPLALKVNWGGPVAYYSLGLAWPDDEDRFRAMLESRKYTDLDLESALAVGVDTVLVDTACGVDWRVKAGDDAVAAVPYTDQDGVAREIIAVRLAR